MKTACIFLITLLTGAATFANFDNVKGTGVPYTIVDRDANCKSPVKNNFQTFSATRQGKNIQVSWAANDTYNDQYYALERSTNGADWKQIAIALGTDISTMPQFAYIDKNINTTVYYRIHQIGANGNDHYSTVRLVHNNKSK
jgi:hypothetical protein